MSRYYIAYGSNLSVEQMRHRTPKAKIVGTAVLRGWRLLFKSYPFRPKQKHGIQGMRRERCG